MKKTEVDEILATVEEIREELHPEIGSEFVEAVVRAEELNADDDKGALRAIEDALVVELERQSATT
jgi:hypothetical protein